MEQYNIFGEIVKAQEILKPTRKFRTMQELYGIKENESCKTCKCLLKYEYHNKTYYKCGIWRVSQSAATDIRLKDKACGKWVKA